MDDHMTDYHIRLQKIEYLATKMNTGLELILVIDGELTVETNSRFYSLNERDLLVLNRNELYQIRGKKENSVLMLNISDTYMDRYYPEYRNTRFHCYSREVDLGRELIISAIRRLLAETIIAQYRKDESWKIEIQKNISEILLTLIRRFKQKGSVFEKIDTGDPRLTEIIDYMERNYSQMITLEDVAKRSYLSAGYLSRYFKQKMGMGFNRFLTNIRLKHCVKDLLYTTESISHIALKNGFANTNSFTRFFKESYGQTPNMYRKKHANQQADAIHSYPLQNAVTLIESADIFPKLGSLLASENPSYSHPETRYEEIHLDLSMPAPANLNLPKHLLMIRELKELLKEDIQTQVLTVKEELRLHHIGIQHLLSGETIAPTVETDEVIPTTSLYFDLDRAIYFLVKHGLSLFIYVDYKEISQDEEGYFKKLNDFSKHCLHMYGESYVNTWHFMFYEPYYKAVQGKEFHRVYLRLYHTLKHWFPEISVGVFLPFSFTQEKTDDNHAWILEESKHIDFIGYHSNQNEIVDFNRLEDDRYFLSKDYLLEKTLKIKAFLKRHQMEKPLHLTTWNTLSGNTRRTNGTFFRGALVLKNILDAANEVESIGFWINTQIHEKDGEVLRLRMEGLELFHYFSGKRPAYFAALFANKLQGKVIAQGSDYIMMENARGYQLVLMNCNNINPYFALEESFLRKLNKDLCVTITGLQPGKYQIRKYIFDKEHGALYTNWWRMNSKYGLDQEMIESIIRSSHPALEIYDETLKEDWSFFSYLTSNAIHFFDIRKVVD